jgi:predicted ATP-grasp superfamily ATP-dependent carboligase
MASIIYVTRDIERALGKEPIGNYFIIANETSYARALKEKYTDNIQLIQSPEILDTYELLLLPEVQKFISEQNEAQILVFKNTIHIEAICKEKGWKLLNPSAELSERVENKITQVTWLGELSTLLPPHTITTVEQIVWNKKAFVLQWSHGHTGGSTLLIQNENDLNDLKKKFPHREARVTDFLHGSMFTSNIVVTDTVILLGNISYQITGMLPFTDNAFSTIGNDWSVTHSIMDEAHIEKFEKIAELVAQKMQKDGWRGLFGIDVMFDEERNELYLIEINARQPASTTLESELQSSMRMLGVPGVTTFEAHLSALQHIPVTSPLVPINDGAQIVQRLTKTVMLKNEKDFEDLFHIQKLLEAGYKTITYKNIKPNDDLLRIQSGQGIMLAHNKFNKRGKEIVDIITE